jgi:hypothetical protein
LNSRHRTSTQKRPYFNTKSDRTPTQGATALQLKTPHSNSKRTAPELKQHRTVTQELPHANARNTARERKQEVVRRGATRVVLQKCIARYFYTILYTSKTTSQENVADDHQA